VQTVQIDPQTATLCFLSHEIDGNVWFRI